MRVEVVPAAAEHIAVIAANAREADVDELWAATRDTPESCMHRGLDGSARAYAGIVDGEPVCMFGVTPVSILGGIGTPWMVGSRAMDKLKVQKALLKHSRPLMQIMREQFPTCLFNCVDQRNSAAIRWLTWLGFSFGPSVPVGPEGVLFIVFYWRPDLCVQ